MQLRALLIVIVHATFAFLCNGEVVDKEFSKCKEFFYKNKPPEGLDHLSGSSYICQTLKDESTNKDHVYFATHFSKAYRIPIYSAYRLDSLACPANQPSRRSTWFNEPQLYNPHYPKSMQLAGANTDNYKVSQAINKDYPNTNFDKGHLNPNFYQCNRARVATFTLTNSVPQDPCFNQQIWKQMEEMAKALMTDMCSFSGAKRYFVTGAIPTHRGIPNEWHDKEEDRNRGYNRVSVPSGMWTAACCDSSTATKAEDRNKGFSFAYFGDNVPESWVIPGPVSWLQNKLIGLYQAQVVDIFADSCHESSENSKKALEVMAVPVERKVAETMSSLGKSSQSSMPPAKRKYVKTVDDVLDTKKPATLQDWRVNDMQYGILAERDENQRMRAEMSSTGLITMLKSSHVELEEEIDEQPDKEINEQNDEEINELSNAPKPEQTNDINAKPKEENDAENQPSDDIDERLLFKINKPVDETEPNFAQPEATKEDKYVVVPTTERQLSANGDRCRANHACGYHGHKYEWCYTDWSNHWDYCCTGSCDFHKGTSYTYCDTGNTWAHCSQRSSMLTVANKPCRPDHECAKHGHKYYWCYTDTNNNWDYCCQPWHDCLTHGSSYNWCYVGNKKKTTWKKCFY